MIHGTLKQPRVNLARVNEVLLYYLFCALPYGYGDLGMGVALVSNNDGKVSQVDRI